MILTDMRLNFRWRGLETLKVLKALSTSTVFHEIFLTPLVFRSGWHGSLAPASVSVVLSLGWQPLLLLPIAALNMGGLAFLCLYCGLLLVLGGPLLVMEMFLGQVNTT